MSHLTAGRRSSLSTTVDGSGCDSGRPPPAPARLSPFARTCLYVFVVVCEFLCL